MKSSPSFLIFFKPNICCLVACLFCVLFYSLPNLSLADPGRQRSGFHVGFTRLTVDHSIEKNLRFSVWYPSLEAPGKVKLGPFQFPGTKNANLAPGKFPIVVLSHGMAGTDLGHRSIAIALAKSGVIAAAPLHPKDNFRDDSGSGLPEVWVARPKQISAVLDHLLQSDQFASSLLPNHIGVFGFSAGGYTAIALLGPKPNFVRLVEHCASSKQSDPVCRYFHGQNSPKGSRFIAQLETYLSSSPSPFASLADDRFCSGVIADPLGWVFPESELAKLKHTPLLIYVPEIQNELAGEFHGMHVFRHVDKPGSGAGSPLTQIRMIKGAQHFSFITPFPQKISRSLGEVAEDFGDFNRAQFHERLAEEISRFFSKSFEHCGP